jgi:excisionase family DNA binding protein
MDHTHAQPPEAPPGDPPEAKEAKKRKRVALSLSTSSPYLTPDEAADLLRTTKRAVYRLHERGALPGARRFGRRLLVRRADLVRSIEQQKPEKVRAPAQPDGDKR